MNNIIAPQGASRLPKQGSVIDWTFCSTKESYLAFVREWKHVYRWLSLDIRQHKLEVREAFSERANPGNPKAADLEKRAIAALNAKNSIGLPAWVTQEKFMWSSTATWLLEVRAQAKIKAAEAWTIQHAKLSG